MVDASAAGRLPSRAVPRRHPDASGVDLVINGAHRLRFIRRGPGSPDEQLAASLDRRARR